MSNLDLELKNITKKYDDNVAVKDFNLSVKKGEFVALLGPSGCGKTTTLKMVGGFEDPTTGDIFVKGSRINEIPPNKRTTNMVFQNFALFPHMNVRENIEYGLKLKHIDAQTRKEKMQYILDLVQMEDYAERKIDELSGGQRQRIAIARSLVLEPDILLLDEPLGALDAHLRARVQVELKTLQKRLGITFIFVTHSQSEAMSMADKIVVMSNGEIEQVGSPIEIYNSPKNKFVAKFVGNNNLIDGKVNKIVENQVELSTLYGTFVIDTSKDSLSIGAEATIVIRADQIKILNSTKNQDPNMNFISGKLIGEEFVGSLITCIVELKDGSQFVVEQHESLSEENIKLNSNITLMWGKGDAILV